MYSSGDSLCIIMLVSKTMKSEKRRAPPAAIILSIRTVGKKICWNRIYLLNVEKSIFKCNIPQRKITLCIQSKMKKNPKRNGKKRLYNRLFLMLWIFYEFVGNLTVLDLYLQVQCSSKKDNSLQNKMLLMFRGKKIITDMVK